MSILLIIIGAIFGNFALGCCVLAAIDTDDRALFRWVKDNPLGEFGYVLIVSAWPAIVITRWSARRSGDA
jgi:hypothetical protein